MKMTNSKGVKWLINIKNHNRVAHIIRKTEQAKVDLTWLEISHKEQKEVQEVTRKKEAARKAKDANLSGK
ncbi:hypothetical protein GH733_008662 [Mirounga leonina]|nr:hypothetical protein GH733_008662 [Mirounga leonina]